MPQPSRSAPRRLLRAGALVLAGGLASAALAGNTLQWRLSAQVPVICAIIAVETPADRPAALAIATSCNAPRYQLLLHSGAQPASLRAAHSSAGPVQVSGGAVTITSSRPGHALTTVELESPAAPGRLSVTLQPL